jgi:DNA gyrase/topoisomerase IV subunit B
MASQYNEDSIQILESQEAVRTRPAMYIGDTGKKGLHHLVWEILDNSVDEHMAGHCSKIDVIISKDNRSVTIIDNGRGIPVAVKQEDPKKRSTLEIVLTELHAGGKFGDDGSGYEASGGLHGVGASCVNFLSLRLDVEVSRDKKKYLLSFDRGIPAGKVEEVGNSSSTGTKITFTPDYNIFGQFAVEDAFREHLIDDFEIDEVFAECSGKWRKALINGEVNGAMFYDIFKPINVSEQSLYVIYRIWHKRSNDNIHFDEAILLRRLRETAYLNGGLKICYKNDSTGIKEDFYFEGGISDYVSYLTKSRTNVYPSKPFFFENKLGKINVQVAFQYGEEDDETLYTYANNINTADGGTHLSGFKTSITRVVNQFARSSGVIKEKEPNLTGDDIREGIVGIISVRLPQPQFEGQTKGKLGSQEVESVVNRLFSEAVTEYFEKNPTIVKNIADRAFRAAKARAAAKRASENIKRQSFLGRSGSLPGKLSDCNSEDNVNTELFIVEGDSAAGSSKFGRDPEFQAVMPIRGKIINPEKNDYARLMQNEEVASIISALGTGIRDEFKIEDLRYGKIVIMTDADDDGAHIAALLMTFFYRFMRPLVLAGKLYLAKPPLYRVNVKNQKFYIHTNEELETYRKKYGDKIEVTRFKGLGEMDGDELGVTTMEIGTRHIIKVNVENAEDASDLISTLMGSEVAPRKEHIIKKSAIRASEENV